MPTEQLLRFHEAHLTDCHHEDGGMIANADLQFATSTHPQTPVLAVRRAEWTWTPDAGHALQMPSVNGSPAAALDRRFGPIVERRLVDLSTSVGQDVEALWRDGDQTENDKAFAEVSHVRFRHVRECARPDVCASLSMKVCKTLTVHQIWLLLVDGRYGIAMPQEEKGGGTFRPVEPITNGMLHTMTRAAELGFREIARNDDHFDWTVAFSNGAITEIRREHKDR